MRGPDLPYQSVSFPAVGHTFSLITSFSLPTNVGLEVVNNILEKNT